VLNRRLACRLDCAALRKMHLRRGFWIPGYNISNAHLGSYFANHLLRGFVGIGMGRDNLLDLAVQLDLEIRARELVSTR
jgi:hypothetical protein